ncbi:MAG TPA: DPP IV N-terminal domain-containing protein [Candidatus Angelobacter sp.]|nr:DPP IV N-terminal domain-containing protein [Candidatus Angelobacter sp.]
MSRNTRFLIAVMICANVCSCFAQGTLTDYQRAERFLPWNVRKLVAEGRVFPRWIGDSHRFWYLKEGHGSPSKQFILVDAERGTQEPAFDSARIAAELSKQIGKPVQPESLPFDDVQFTEPNAIEFKAADLSWKCDLKEYRCASRPVAEDPSVGVPSPDKHWVAFVRDYNLWLRSTSTGQEVQLTRDGEKGYDYATPLPSLGLMVKEGTDRAKESPAVFWSPDSSRLVTYRLDSRNVGRLTAVQFVPPSQMRPKAFNYGYPLPGEDLPRAQPVIFSIADGKRTDVDGPQLDLAYYGGPDFSWFKDSKRFYFQVDGRAERFIEIREADVETGKTRVLVREESDKYVDPILTVFEPIDDGKQFLWTSERDGWNHLYLYDGKTGRLVNQVTKGDWVMRRLVQVDEKSRQVYFLGAGREAGEDPYQVHLYRVNLDGSGLKLLTPENAYHSVSLSPDSAFFVDNFSRPDSPPMAVLRRSSDGRQIRELEKADISDLLKTGWKFPEPFRGKGRDGATEGAKEIDGLIWRPSNFDPSRKYPVIEEIYTGPHGFFVPKTFSAYREMEQSLAELGFIVVKIDGQGTEGRSRAFHLFSYKNLGDGGIDDHIALMRQMAERYPYMDLTRVGIYGGSAGGYDTVHAMLTHPGFYKVGVSISGNHDHRLDKTWWNELWMGYPVGANYDQQSNITMADRLQGHLLLVHGDIDENVPLFDTMRLADALMKANKDFDMLIVPNQGHLENGNPYLMRRRWDYFVMHLLGVTPPSGFEIHGRGPKDASGYYPGFPSFPDAE